MSWVVVQFAECRDVIMDAVSQGDNMDAQGRLEPKIVNAGVHTFTLGGAPNFAPASQTVNVPEVPVNAPFAVVFTKTV